MCKPPGVVATSVMTHAADVKTSLKPRAKASALATVTAAAGLAALTSAPLICEDVPRVAARSGLAGREMR